MDTPLLPEERLLSTVKYTARAQDLEKARRKPIALHENSK